MIRCLLVVVSACAATDAGLVASEDAITVTRGPGRDDPEGIAPPAPEVRIVRWRDSRGSERELQLYGYLYGYDLAFDDGTGSETRVHAGDDAYGHPGFGYVVSHTTANGNSPLGKANAPTVTTELLSGAHHAIHRVELVYDRDVEPGGFGIGIPVTIEWFVATGRDAPIWSVTWHTADAINPNAIDFDSYRMDSRGPYGSLGFDGAETRDTGDTIGGVAWGDFALAFTTTDAELTLASPWTYDTPNRVAFTQAWTAHRNAELGIVQTRPGDLEMGMPDRVVGRERGTRSTAAYPGKASCGDDPRHYSVPCIAGWPYQLMNWDWDATGGKAAADTTGTKLLAWGTPYGWIGASSFEHFDRSGRGDGRGDRAYATVIAMGPKCRFDAAGMCRSDDGETARARRAIAALASAVITPAVGGVLGYDDRYAVHRVTADANRVAFTLATEAPIEHPIFVVHDYTGGLPVITVAGEPRLANAGGAFVSLDPDRHELWVTLDETLAGATPIEIGD